MAPYLCSWDLRGQIRRFSKDGLPGERARSDVGPYSTSVEL